MVDNGQSDLQLRLRTAAFNHGNRCIVGSRGEGCGIGAHGHLLVSLTRRLADVKPGERCWLSRRR